MDTFAHLAYGITCCSRTGFAGGRAWPARRGVSDWTVWAAAAFGLFPDAASIGVRMVDVLLRHQQFSFHTIPPYVFVLYAYTHSLVLAAVALVLIRRFCRPLFVPALAWPLHIATDIFTHGVGRFQTPFLFPVSDYKLGGFNWWETPWFFVTYWGFLLVIWIGLILWRARPQARRSA